MVNRKQITIESYDRTRYNKPEKVRTHTKNIRVSDIDEKARERIKFGKAKKLFEDRSERGKKMDRKQQSRIMFAVPNMLWANTINRYDIWGLDGYNPPEVEKLPESGLPFQVVRYKNEIYKADAKGIFTTPDLKIRDLDPHSEKEQERFEKEHPDKNALWNDKITKSFQKWIDKNAELEEIAGKLNYKNPHNKLYQMQELYNSLNLSEKDMKKMMLHLYNKVYVSEAKSYTKDFMEFYEHRYDDKLERDMNRAKREQKERMTDPVKKRKRQEQYKTSGLRFSNLRRMLDKTGYQYDSQQVRAEMEYLEDDEIIADVKAQQTSELGDIGAGEVDWQTIEKDEYQKMVDYYEQKSYDEYLTHLQQEAFV